MQEQLLFREGQRGILDAHLPPNVLASGMCSIVCLSMFILVLCHPPFYFAPLTLSLSLSSLPSFSCALCSSWNVSALAAITLVNQEDPKSSFTRDIYHCFCAKENDWGFSSFMGVKVCCSSGTENLLCYVNSLDFYVDVCCTCTHESFYGQNLIFHGLAILS